MLDAYRFGFNGAENLNEVKGYGNTPDLGDRWHDPRLGKLIYKIDRKASQYPWQSPYAYYANSPIWQIDYNGEGDGIEKAKNITIKVASFTDINDATILTTWFTRRNTTGAIDIEGEPAGKVDKAFAVIGAAIPFVSGSTVKEGLKLGVKSTKWTLDAVKYGTKSADAIANRTKLRDALKIVKGSSDRAHHLIPIDLIKSNKTVREAIDQGFDFNGVVNGLAIDASRHTGRHPEVYMQGVSEIINATKKAMPKASAKEIMENVAGQLKTMINSTDKKVNELFTK